MHYTDVLDVIIVVILVVGCRHYDMYGMSCSMKYSWLFTMSHSQLVPSNRLIATTKN